MRARPGSTLIEAAAAISLGTIAVLLGYSIMATSMDTRRNTLARAEADLRGAALRELLAEWLSSAHTPLGTPGYRYLVRDVQGDGYGDELVFASRHARPFVDVPVEITLRWSAVAGTQTLTASFRDIHTGVGVGDTVVLSRWISVLRVTVRPETGDAWLGHWTSSITLPASVRVDLESADPDSLSVTVATPVLVRLHSTQ